MHRISNVERDVAGRWTRAYAVASMLLWPLLAWVAYRGTIRRSAILAPPIDYVPWCVVVASLLAIAAYGAVRRRAWAGYLGFFGGLCLLAYQFTAPYVFSRMMAHYSAFGLGGAALAVHLPVVALSIRRDALAGTVCAFLVVTLTAGVSLGWALGFRAHEACRGEYPWQQELACPEWVLTARERGREAARHDRDAGIHRRLATGLMADDERDYEHWLWAEYGVQTDTLAGCVVHPAIMEYMRGYDEVARPWMDAHLEASGGTSRVEQRWRLLGGGGPNAVRTTPERPRPWPLRPLDPPPPDPLGR